MIYRTLAGARADAAPLPSRRTLLRPLGWSAVVLLAATVPAIVFDLAVSPAIVGEGKGARWTPELDVVEDALAILGVASLVVLGVMIFTRVRPLWSGMTAARRGLYVASMIATQLVLVTAGEAALALSRGWPALFEPQLVASARSPATSERAYAYRSCLLGCTYEVFDAEPHALLVHRRATITRSSEVNGVAIQWRDGAAQLVDARGTVLTSEPWDVPVLFPGGC